MKKIESRENSNWINAMTKLGVAGNFLTAERASWIRKKTKHAKGVLLQIEGNNLVYEIKRSISERTAMP